MLLVCACVTVPARLNPIAGLALHADRRCPMTLVSTNQQSPWQLEAAAIWVLLATLAGPA